MRALWGEVRLAVEAARMDHKRIARVVWLLWEYRQEGDEWEALRDYAVRGLEGCATGTVALSDVVVWMCAEGEQEGESPSAWFRAGWAWCVMPPEGTAFTSPILNESGWCAWARNPNSSWAIAFRQSAYGSSREASRANAGGAWPDHLDTQPIKEAA